MPILGLTGLARTYILQQSRADFRDELERAREKVDQEFRRAKEEVRRSAERRAADRDLIGWLLAELARGPLDDETQQTLNDRLEGALPGLGLDVLELVDERGTIVAISHFPGRLGESDPDALKLARVRAGQ